MQQKHLTPFLAFTLLFISILGQAQIPAGYYDDANGKTGYTLKTSLYNIIKDHNSQSYSALWTAFQTSDKKSNGKVWDMYSDVPGGTPAYEYTFVTDQCGSYSGEGSCYNREHSFPKSWFDDASPMYTDPFHIVPSDGYVNGKRGNLPFGEVGSASWTSTNGSKVGNSNYPGYSGEVFEPIDEYKGDFARGYFYMATRYENIISGWENNNSNGDAMLNGTSDQVFEDWALAMLIDWHNADPVSQKEIDRNDAIYDFQNNRNPFIDHPEYVSSIWGGAPSATINVTESLNDFGDVAFGDVSTTQSYTVSGSDLTDDISITSNNGFEIALTDSEADYTTNLSLPQSSGTVGTTTVFVRLKPTSDSNNDIDGTIIHTSAGATSQTLNVSGSEYHEVIPEINFNFSSRTIDPTSNYEVQLFANEAPNKDMMVLIELANSTGLTYNDNYTTSPSLTNDVMELTWPSGELNTTFSIDFETSLLDDIDPGSLSFIINENDDYVIGTNNDFDLHLKGTGIISGSDDAVSSLLVVYPNPADHNLNIKWEVGHFEYYITDLTGKILKNGNANHGTAIDVSNFSRGNYLVQLLNANSKITRKVTIN